VLLALAIITILLAIGLMSFFHQHWIAYGLMFLFGGITFTLYPVSISHTCDALAHDNIVSGTQGVLLSYSVGAAAGPFLSPLFIHSLGPNGFFIYIVTICSALALFLCWKKIRTPAKPQEDSFIVMPRTTPVTAEMDPRGH
jgi:MFS family permease